MVQAKITTAAELERLRESIIARQGQYRARVLICMTGCRALGAAQVAEAFREGVAKAGLDRDVAVVETGCLGLCARAPLVLIEPYEYLYGGVTPGDVDEVIETTIGQGRPVEALIEKRNGTARPRVHDSPFYEKQQRIVLENCGRMDPKRIEDAIGRGGYAAAVKALTAKTPQEVIDEITASGLKGRGGAGFSTGAKWGLCRKSAGREKYLICNADEGDPGAFMDRALLEGDPHRVLEGMIIAAYAIGATHGFVYVRAEYPIAVEHVTIALDEARAYGLLGENILNTGFNFDIEVRMGAGAFVCGEETALIASLEGKRGMPSPRPPFPTEKGYQGKPTNINNVETFGNVPPIITRGAGWYKAMGTEGSKGTKIFALAGKVNNTGLVEVPMGITLRQIVYEVGGGIPKGRQFKAAQMGGPSGGCVPAKYLDLPLDYDSLKAVGAIMGSGGLIVMDENTCMVDIARFFLQFVQSESCGKCVPCRVGTRHMLDILNRITRGEGRMEDLDKLEDLAKKVRVASLCGLGQTAPNPVLSTLRHFRQEYIEHILLKRCRAGSCEGLVSAPCSHACPAGVNVPEYVTLIGENRIADAANIIRRRNPFLSVCGRVCDHPCERRCRRSDVDEPLAIQALKRYASDHDQCTDLPMVPRAGGKAEIAIVGAGPAGLACGYFLALLGRPSIIFEAQPIPGGMLALGIPEYRLPKRILQKDIDFILSHGVTLETNHPVNDLTALSRQGFRAVFVATGAQKSRRLNIPGEQLGGVVDSLEFLRSRGLNRPLPVGRHVTVIGGGNAAVDAARSALRLGARKVTILYRRSREEMPAYSEEIHAALEEGIELLTHVAPTRFVSSNGHVEGVELQRMELGSADDDGRRRPVAVAGSEFVVPCDLALPAVGQEVTVPCDGAAGLEFQDDRRLKVRPETLETGISGIFAGGDCLTGGGTVIEAIGDGQRAAIAIDKSLGGAGLLPPDGGLTYRRVGEESADGATARSRPAELEPHERKNSFTEVVLGLEEKAAQCEAFRCLRCDLERRKTKPCRPE